MMGIYPITFSLLVYAVTTPSFDEIEIRLDTTYYPRRTLVIKANDPVKNPYIKSITIGGQITKDWFISHEDLVRKKLLIFDLKSKK